MVQRDPADNIGTLNPTRHTERYVHWALLLLCLVFVGVAQKVAVTGQLAAMGDDSVSYLALAHYFAGHTGQWADFAPMLNHFPPLWPWLLAAVGAGEHLPAGQWLVVACFGASLPLFYALARRHGLAPGLAWTLTALLALLPQTWLRQMGVMSEGLYLLLTLAALYCANRESPRWLAAFALLCGALLLTRTIGVVMTLAGVVTWLGPMLWRRRWHNWRPAALVALPPLVILATWFVFRPGSERGDMHVRYVSILLQTSPELLLRQALELLQSWQAQFLVYGDITRNGVLVGLLGLWCFAAAVWRCRHWAADGWYVIGSLPVLWVWTLYFPAETHRLFYPLTPVLLLQGALLAQALWQHHRAAALLPVGLFGIALVLTVLADAWLLRRALDPTMAAGERRYAESQEYYQHVDETTARQKARRTLAALVGFEWMRTELPKNAVVMWSQPHYVAVLAQRRGIGYRASWNAAEWRAQMRQTGTTHVLYTAAAKGDFGGGAMRLHRMAELEDVATPIFAIPGGDGRFDVLVLEIKR